MTSGRLPGLASAAAVAVLLLVPLVQSAVAQGGGAIGPEGENEGGGTVSASVETRVVITTSGGPGDGGRPVTPLDSNWSPPACWYEPAMTPRQLEEAVAGIQPQSNLVPVTNRLRWGRDLMHEAYRDGGRGNPPNYNLEQQGEGMWWRAVTNPNRSTEMASFDCNELMFWVDEGADPGVTGAVTPEILAGYAYDSVRVPRTEIDTQPLTVQKVNLPTWISQRPQTFTPVSVTASLPGTGMWATTTARPKSLAIKPGTSDATVHPASAECAIHEDGSVGRRHARGDGDSVPPCGITYERATARTGPYELSAAITWGIDWEGSGGSEGDLPDGTFETVYDIEVEEIQTVIR